MDKEESNEELEINEVEELTEEEGEEVTGGAHAPVSKGMVRIVKHHAMMATTNGIENGRIKTGRSIEKGERVTILKFSDSTGVKINGKPATLIKCYGTKWYIPAEVIANSFPK